MTLLGFNLLALVFFVALFVIIDGQFFPGPPPPWTLDPWGRPMPFWRRRRPCNFLDEWEVLTRRRCFHEMRRLGWIPNNQDQFDNPQSGQWNNQQGQWPQTDQNQGNNVGWTTTRAPQQVNNVGWTSTRAQGNNVGWTTTRSPQQQLKPIRAPTTGNRPSNNNDPLNILGTPSNIIQTQPTTTIRPVQIWPTTTRPSIITTQRPIFTTTFRPIITTTRPPQTRPTFKPVAGPNNKFDPNSDAFIPPPPA